MFIDTKAIGFAMTDGILRHANARVKAALGPFAGNVLSVTVRLEDINADRGGIDKRCSAVVALRRRGVVVAEATHEDLYAAVDRAAMRLRRSVRRAVKRRLALTRRDAQRHEALVLA